MMELSIIIINWHSKKFLKNCLKTIIDNTINLAYEIIVVDNASYDGCETLIKKHFPDVKFIQSNKNLGFAKANNLAYQYSSGHNILFLNPDTEIIDNAISNLLKNLEELPNAGIVGPILLNSDLTIQESCVQSYPTIINQVLDSQILRNLFPKSNLWGNSPIYNSHDKPYKVDSVSGASLMIKRSIFEKVKYFSEDYFMYSEDIDLCYKVNQLGYDIYFIPNAKILHYGGGSSEKHEYNQFSSIMQCESQWIFFKKHRSIYYALSYRMAIAMTALTRMTVAKIIRGLAEEASTQEKYQQSYKKWKAKLKWSIIPKLSNR